ncbi:MAG: CDP-alcohol phosphatidyltransferase family protein [Phycisphaerae bacterium]
MRIVGRTTGQTRRKRRRERVLKTIAVLPSLATLGNLVCGLGAVYLCLLSVQAAGADLSTNTLNNARLENLFPTYLAIAAYLLMGAMVFDALDGRLARFARKTSEFGGQLDSLADIVSFGVAPAVLVLCIVQPGHIADLTMWGRVYWRAEWVMAATFVCCAALRLAKFNVENVEDESAHLGFHGLPTPGAAAAIITLVILHEDLLKAVAPTSVCHVVARALPPMAMVLGLLMVSRLPYLHLVNNLLRGRRPFRQVVAILIAGLIGLVVQFQLTIALAAVAYALSGPIIATTRHLRGQAPMSDTELDGEAPDWTTPGDLFEDADEDRDDDSARPAI